MGENVHLYSNHSFFNRTQGQQIIGNKEVHGKDEGQQLHFDRFAKSSLLEIISSETTRTLLFIVYK